MKPIKVKFEKGVFKPIEETDEIEEGTIGKVYVEENPSVRSTEFFGLWKNRKEIKDGLSYVKELRSKSRY
jgi:predicted DNA-binding antitoxin AbrB/MazE fold protein